MFSTAIAGSLYKLPWLLKTLGRGEVRRAPRALLRHGG
jgi:hypothetical protein